MLLHMAINNKVIKDFLVTAILIITLAIPVYSQEIRINCTDKPLNDILIQMRDDYSLMVSFDDQKLASYKLTLDRKFFSPSLALDYLFKGLPLRYEVNNGVFIIYTMVKAEKPRSYLVSGSVSDKTNHETLPFSSILINNKGFFSDAKGNFSFASATDSIFSMKISYLGYYILDTIVPQGSNYNFRLTPSIIAMKEIVVLGSAVERSIQTGNAPGIIKLNHKIAYYLPGNGDNSVFNLLSGSRAAPARRAILDACRAPRRPGRGRGAGPGVGSCLVSCSHAAHLRQNVPYLTRAATSSGASARARS